MILNYAIKTLPIFNVNQTHILTQEKYVHNNFTIKSSFYVISLEKMDIP